MQQAQIQKKITKEIHTLSDTIAHTSDFNTVSN